MHRLPLSCVKGLNLVKSLTSNRQAIGMHVEVILLIVYTLACFRINDEESAKGAL
jgi:hypothetical protein